MLVRAARHLRIVGVVGIVFLLSPGFLQPVQAVEVDNKFDAYMRAGIAATEARDYENAVTYFGKAVELAPDRLNGRVALEEAVRARGRAHAKSEALAAAGDAALDSDDFDKAITYYEKALDAWSESRRARQGLASAFGRKQGSERERALQLARIYRDRGQWEDSKREYLSALKADPTNATLRKELATVVPSRPLPATRAQVKGWSETLNETLSWLILVIVIVVVTAANLANTFRSRQTIEVVPFDGPDANFRQQAGSGMAAMVSAQLYAAGLILNRGVVTEPLTRLSASVTDAQARLIGDVVAWLFPARGFRLEAIVHAFPLLPNQGTRTGITVKLLRLRFWIPRERVVANITFWEIPNTPVHETLANMAAAWAEWHVTHD